MESILAVLVFLFGLFIGYIIFTPADQEIISKFKNPICIEKEIGKESVKKCYEIKEAK